MWSTLDDWFYSGALRGSPFLGSTIFRAGTRTEYQPAQLRTPPSSSYSASFSRIVDTAGRLPPQNEILEILPFLREVRFTWRADPMYDSPWPVQLPLSSPSTPGGQTPLESVSSSIYPPEYIWNSLSEDQRASVISNISASFSLGDGSASAPVWTLPVKMMTPMLVGFHLLLSPSSLVFPASEPCRNHSHL